MAVRGRIGLVLHPRRDCAAAVGQVAAWTSTHDVELVAAEADVARLALAGVTRVPVAELAAYLASLRARLETGALRGTPLLPVRARVSAMLRPWTRRSTSTSRCPGGSCRMAPARSCRSTTRFRSHCRAGASACSHASRGR
jgi:hypothetical protein